MDFKLICNLVLLSSIPDQEGSKTVPWKWNGTRGQHFLLVSSIFFCKRTTLMCVYVCLYVSYCLEHRNQNRKLRLTCHHRVRWRTLTPCLGKASERRGNYSPAIRPLPLVQPLTLASFRRWELEVIFKGQENSRLVSKNKGGNDLGREYGDKQQEWAHSSDCGGTRALLSVRALGGCVL